MSEVTREVPSLASVRAPANDEIAILLWTGGVGGAETLMADVAISMRARSIDASVLCIGDATRLAGRLHGEAVHCSSLGYQRGSAVALHPRRLAATVRKLGRDGAIVNAAGYLPWLIRAGGYQSPMLVVEHGDALNLHTAPFRRKLRVRAERWLCASARYTDIAVSETLLQASVRATGRRDAKRIYNGVNLTRFSPPPQLPAARDGTVTIGVASRLAPGKGIDNLLRACALLGTDLPWKLRIAGDGPEEGRLRAQAESDPVLRARVHFEGAIADMPRFWQTCDLAVVASSGWIESFSMAAVEAMACGIPVVASASGALPEICGEGCGTLISVGDVEALAAALRSYIGYPARREAHGTAARRRAEQQFDIERMVDLYLEALRAARH